MSKSTKDCENACRQAETHRSDGVVPLDFSFLQITQMSDFEIEEPRVQGDKRLAKVVVHAEKEGEEDTERYEGKCLRINNNHLADLKGFDDTLRKIIVDPSLLTWIDLSCNNLTLIDECLTELEQLKILYLHSNNIEDVTQVKKLAKNTNLYKLTLHCNPIVHTKNYRMYVLAHVPNLKMFDFSGVSKADRACAATINFSKLKTGKKAVKDN